VAAAKGLIAGSLRIRRKDNSIIDYSLEQEGGLIPNTKDIHSFQLNDVSWVMVIEKEVRYMNTSSFLTIMLTFLRLLSVA
jgi:meiotic recombination protein SPO11